MSGRGIPLANDARTWSKVRFMAWESRDWEYYRDGCIIITIIMAGASLVWNHYCRSTFTTRYQEGLASVCVGAGRMVVCLGWAALYLKSVHSVDIIHYSRTY